MPCINSHKHSVILTIIASLNFALRYSYYNWYTWGDIKFVQAELLQRWQGHKYTSDFSSLQAGRRIKTFKNFSFDMQKNTSEVQSICRSGTLLVKVNLQVGD
jgi:hypothetical protein